jgi:hypothetical protein
LVQRAHGPLASVLGRAAIAAAVAAPERGDAAGRLLSLTDAAASAVEEGDRLVPLSAAPVNLRQR